VNLILIERAELDDASRATLGGARAAHAIDVLRARPGHVLRVGIIDGPMGEGQVERVTPHEITLSCAFTAEPPRPAVDLLLALPRPKVLKRLWAQVAALGVDRLVLTNAARVERNYFDAQALDPRIYRPLLIEGLQQARDTHVPQVRIERQFRKFVEDDLDAFFGPGARLLAHPDVASLTVHAALSRRPASRVLLAVGPEGGWNDFELRLLEARGFVCVSMGQRTLRSDTAVIALLALVHSARASHAKDHA